MEPQEVFCYDKKEDRCNNNKCFGIITVILAIAFSFVVGLLVGAVAIASEIFDLYRSSVLMSSEVILDSAGINPSALSIGGYGAHLCNLMELNNNSCADSDEAAMCADILAFLTEGTVVKI